MSMIEVKKLRFGYTKEDILFENISFSISKGEFVALLGENGVGKSTLVKLLLLAIQPLSGSVHTLVDTSKIGYVPQRMYIDKNHPAKVKELVKDSAICSHLSIEQFLEKQFKSLSGGQQQRVLVALALENNPSLIFLDEPTIGIDSKSKKEFYSLLSHLSKKHGKTILLITHDDHIVSEYVDSVFLLQDKQLQKLNPLHTRKD